MRFGMMRIILLPIKTNLQVASLVGFRTDMLLFFNEKGEPVYYAILTPDNTKLAPLPKGFEEYLKPKSKLVYLPENDGHVEGIAATPSGLLITAAHAIVKGDNSGPVHGSLVAVKYFTPAVLEKLKTITKLDIVIYPIADLNKFPDIKDINEKLNSLKTPLIEKNNNTLFGYAYLRDLENKPVAIIKITMPREIYAAGLESIKYFSIAFVSTGLIFLILLLSLLSYLITNRLERLNHQLINISKTKQFEKRVSVEGSDELTSVEKETNQLLDTIQNDNNEKMKLTQQVVQNEKLASLGVLTAGIAHEINNPINFVLATTEPLQSDFDSMSDLLNSYIKIQSGKEFDEQKQSIEKLKEETNVEEVTKEVKKIISSIKEGAERTANIVKDLKTFTRFDENAMKKSDIQAGLDSTIMLLTHKYGKRIKIIKEYNPIPLVDCYPGKINQVFMNVLANACEAIVDKGEIHVSTKQVNNHVEIHIKDTGYGIKPENISKVFEPFYTTKDVGQGTGLGLSISYGIINDHGGKIEVMSEIGVGTEFVIILPINNTAR
jgi:signal transduction histidine kinase